MERDIDIRGPGLRVPAMKKTALPILGLTLAGLFAPVLPARADTVYVVNNFASNVMAFTSAGVGTIFANTGFGAWSLAFDTTGNLFVGNPTNTTLEKFSSTGTDLGLFAAVGPTGLAFDTAGNLYASDATDNTVKRYTPGGSGSVFATGLNYPTGLAFDSAGNLFVANGNSNSIEKFSSTGTDLGVFAGSGGASPYGLAFDSAGNLFVANNGGGGIVKITPGGVGSPFANLGATPVGLAFDSAGDLYATYNQPYNFIEKFSPAGTDLGVFANTGLSNPMFIAIQIPEPTSAMLLLGSGAMLLLRRRRASAF